MASKVQPALVDFRGACERVDSVVSFWGQAFQALDDAVRPLLVLAPGIVSFLPDTAWQFHEGTRVEAVGGWLQGAALTFGEGRVVILGEAGMLTAQFTGARRQPMGMNARRAGRNGQFALNIMHWLSGLLPEPDD